MEKTNLDAAFDSFEEQWSPRLAAELNGQAVKLAKLEGEFVWHHHDDADEFFSSARDDSVSNFGTPSART